MTKFVKKWRKALFNFLAYLYPLLRTISITGDFKYYLHPSLDSVSEYIHNKARLGFI